MLRLRKVHQSVRIGSSVFFVFFGVVAIVACSMPAVSKETEPDTSSPSRARDGGTASRPLQPANDGGQPGNGSSSSSPKVPLVDVPACKGKAGIFACLDCCDAALPKRQDVLYDKLKACICKTCSAECKDSTCSATTEPVEDSQQCIDCYSNVGDACWTESAKACDADPSCTAHRKCEEACDKEFPAVFDDGGISGGGGG